MSTTVTTTNTSKPPASTSASNAQPTRSPFPPGSRYELRQLTTHTDALWATAVIVQSLLYSSPIFTKMWTPSAATFDRWLSVQLPLIKSRMSPSWPLSLGVFDTEHEYSTDEAQEAGGKFHWDDWPDEETKKRELENMTLDDLLKRMDFPLVSVALSYDRFQTPDKTMMEQFMKTFPTFGAVLGECEKRDSRSAEERKPTDWRQLLQRHATNTMAGYEGMGFSKKLTYYLIDEARREGFRTMQVNAVHPGVQHILMNAPSPCSARIVAKFETDEVMDEEGKPVFGDVKEPVTRVVVDLN